MQSIASPTEGALHVPLGIFSKKSTAEAVLFMVREAGLEPARPE